MAKVNRRTGDGVLDFLDQQRLEPTPVNYTLGYLFKTGADKGLQATVAEIIDGGIRITPGEVESVMRQYGHSGGVPVAPAVTDADDDAVDAGTAVRHQLLRMMSINEETSQATGQFGRDLTSGIDALAAMPDELRSVIATMVERASAAETMLRKSAVETEQLKQDLETARSDATIDMLTGLPNRRSIDGTLARLAKTDSPRAIAFCDIDRFKSVNDRFGHAVGDRVLKGVAEVLRNTCSQHGTVARWGGEEFVVVFEGAAGIADATTIMDRARVALTEKRFKLRETDEPLGTMSFSAGVVRGSTESNESLTARADQLLYKAKEAGRNRILDQ